MKSKANALERQAQIAQMKKDAVDTQKKFLTPVRKRLSSKTRMNRTKNADAVFREDKMGEHDI